MWWFSSTLLLLLAFSGVIAGVETETENSVKLLKILEIENLKSFDTEKLEGYSDLEEDKLQKFCPAFLKFAENLETAMHEDVGITLEQLRNILPKNRIRNILTVGINLRDFLKDMCVDDPQQHKGVFDDLHEKIELCKKVDLKDIVNALKVSKTNVLEAFCPILLSPLECMEDAVYDTMGITLEELRDLMEGTDSDKYFMVGLNAKNMLEDLCDEDSQLHKDFMMDAQCLKEIENIELCQKQAEMAYDTYKKFVDRVQEKAGEDTEDGERLCLQTAYSAACFGVEIKEKCGQHAFNTFRQIITTLFRYVCKEVQFKTAKTKFLDSLEMDSSQREAYGLALDALQDEEVKKTFH